MRPQHVLMVPVAASLLVLSCATVRLPQPLPKQRECDAPVIITFESGEEPAIDEVAHTARVRLTHIRELSPDTGVYQLRAPGSDPDCALAIARLRRDSRIKSVNLDERRQPQ